MDKFSNGEARVTNEFFESLNGRYREAFESIGKRKWPGDKGKDGYWVSRYIGELEDKAKHHLRAKKALVEACALRDEAGEIVRDEQGTGIRIDPARRGEFEEQFDAQLGIEVGLKINKRVFDLSGKPFDDLSPEEWVVIMPYIANPLESEEETSNE